MAASVIGRLLYRPRTSPLVRLLSSATVARAPKMSGEEKPANDKKKKKATKAAMIQLNLENQLLFGNLLETGAQRRRKKAAEKNPEVPPASEGGGAQVAATGRKRGRPRKNRTEATELTTTTTTGPSSSPLARHLSACRESVAAGRVPDDWDAVRVPMVLAPSDVAPPRAEARRGPSSMPSELKAKLPSVTRVLSETMPPESKALLEAWKQRMIAQLGLEGFQKLQKDTLERGKLLHKFIFDKLLLVPGEEEPTPVISNYVKSVRGVLPSVRNVDVALSEKPVFHPFLGYWGIPDCVASYKGTPVIIDWKTSQRTRRTVENLYDGPIQIAAYLGAVNAMDPERQMDYGVIVVAYESGAPADVHVLSKRVCERFWVKWIERLKLYRGIVAAKAASEQSSGVSSEE